MQRLVIRRPLFLLIYGGLISVLWYGILLSALVRSPGAFAFVGIPFMIFGALVMAPNMMARVIAEGDELRVRNGFREQTYRRRDIDRFVIGAPLETLNRLGGGVSVVLNTGELVNLRVIVSGPFGGARRQRIYDDLVRWLNSPR